MFGEDDIIIGIKIELNMIYFVGIYIRIYKGKSKKEIGVIFQDFIYLLLRRTFVAVCCAIFAGIH